MCASSFLHGDNDTGPWIKSCIKEPHYDYNILQAEQRAEAGSAAAELAEGVSAFAKGRKKPYRRIFLIYKLRKWIVCETANGSYLL